MHTSLFPTGLSTSCIPAKKKKITLHPEISQKEHDHPVLKLVSKIIKLSTCPISLIP